MRSDEGSFEDEHLLELEGARQVSTPFGQVITNCPFCGGVNQGVALTGDPFTAREVRTRSHQASVKTKCWRTNPAGKRDKLRELREENKRPKKEGRQFRRSGKNGSG